MADTGQGILHIKIPAEISLTKNQEIREQTVVYISEEKSDYVEKHSKCKGPGAELYLVSSKNSEGTHVAASRVKEEM